MEDKRNDVLKQIMFAQWEQTSAISLTDGVKYMVLASSDFYILMSYLQIIKLWIYGYKYSLIYNGGHAICLSGTFIRVRSKSSDIDSFGIVPIEGKHDHRHSWVVRLGDFDTSKRQIL